VLNARFGNRVADKWNDLLSQAHAEALEKLGSFEVLKRISLSAITQERREDSGFHYQAALGFSIQYVDSNNAWRHVLTLAKRLGVSVEVQVRWREKEGAAFPGEFGILRWEPTTKRET
jgi:hypothetical protein